MLMWLGPVVWSPPWVMQSIWQRSGITFIICCYLAKLTWEVYELTLQDEHNNVFNSAE